MTKEEHVERLTNLRRRYSPEVYAKIQRRTTATYSDEKFKNVVACVIREEQKLASLKLRDYRAWTRLNIRRIKLIRKSVTSPLPHAEARELRKLQGMADKQATMLGSYSLPDMRASSKKASLPK